LGWSRVHVKTWLKKYVKVAGIAEFDRQSARKPLIFEMGGPGGLKLKFICQDPNELIPK